MVTADDDCLGYNDAKSDKREIIQQNPMYFWKNTERRYE